MPTLSAAEHDHAAQELLDEMRVRLQSAHFSARGLKGLLGEEAQEALADQLHSIRLLADSLARVLGQ